MTFDRTLALPVTAGQRALASASCSFVIADRPRTPRVAD
jgi:hypothetical protein